MGTIFKKKWKDKDGNNREGKYFWIQYYFDGRPKQESSRSEKHADARKLLKKREGEISEGRRPGVFFDKVRFENLVSDFVVDQEINNCKDIKRTKGRIKNHLKPFFGGLRAPQITTDKIRTYTLKRLKENAANATINLELSHLKKMLNLAARCTPPKVPHVPHIPMLKVNNARQGFFEHEQFIALRDALPEDLKGVVTFGYRTGWRSEEVLALTWDRVDLKEGTVSLHAGTTKNDAARFIFVDAVVKESLRQQRLTCPVGISSQR